MSSNLYQKVKFRQLLIEPVRNGIYKQKEFHGRGCKIINMGELFAYPRLYDVPMKRVEINENDAAKSLMQVDDLIFARRSLVASGAGKCSIIKKINEPTTFESSIIRARPDPRLASSDYLYYYFSSPIGRERMGTILRQVAVSGITGSDLMDLEIDCPPPNVQKIIAGVLSLLDDRIALLRETNATFEAIAQALFKSWFVDFDPVRAKQEGRVPEGIDEATAALFPASFEESVLGPVPQGWRVTTIADAFDINPKRHLKKAVRAPYVDMASLATSGHCVDAPIQREMGSGAKFCNGDTLLARITPCLENGKSAFVDFLADEQIGWGSTEFLVLRPKTPLPEYFGYLLCRHSAFREYAIQSMSGTSGRQRVQNDVLGRYLLAVADESVASAFAGVVEPLQRSIAANHDMARTLADMRDQLLPRLISGQLRLPRTVEMADQLKTGT